MSREPLLHTPTASAVKRFVPRSFKKWLKSQFYCLGPGRMEAGGFKALGTSESDRYVFGEIFGSEDAYRKDQLLDDVRGGVVIEIGAHKGYFTILAASEAKKIYAYEVDRFNFGYLKRNVKRNGLSNVICLNTGVSAQSGNRTFNVSHVTDARHSFYTSAFVGESTPNKVWCTSLDELLATVDEPIISVIKLDCEGAEFEILLAASDDSLRRVQTIYAELHQSSAIPFSTADLVGRLESQGFISEMYDPHQRDDVATVMAMFRRPSP